MSDPIKNAISQTKDISVRTAKAMTKMYKAMAEAEDASQGLMNMLDKLSSTNLNPINQFLNTTTDWFAAGGADGMGRLQETLFSPANITVAQNLTTEMGRLTSEGFANLMTAIDTAVPGLAGVTLGIWGMYKALGPVGFVLSAVTAGVQWIYENWEDIVDFFSPDIAGGFDDQLRRMFG